MKTLLITYDFPPMVSGIGTFFYNVWKNMPRSEGMILAPAAKGSTDIDGASGLDITRYPNICNSRFLRMMVLLPYAVYMVKRHRIDMIVCAVPVSIGLIGLFLKKTMGRPYIVFYYGGEFAKYGNNGLILRIIGAVLKGSKNIVANSDFTSKEAESFDVPADKIFKITPGVDSERFRPGIDCGWLREKLGLGDKRVILSVSRLVRRKGIDTVIYAMSKVVEKAPDIVYIVVGNGPDRRYLEDLASAKGLRENVIFAGHVSDDDLPVYYNMCEFYVMPNRQTAGIETLEGFGTSFIEAASCARASIAGRSGGSSEAVIDGRTGLLVDAESLGSVSDAILKLLRDPAYARGLGDNGRERAVRDFSWQSRGQMMDRILKGAKSEE